MSISWQYLRRRCCCVPEYIAALVGVIGALIVDAGQAGNEEVHGVVDGCLPGSASMYGVHLGPHPEAGKELPQGHSVGEVSATSAPAPRRGARWTG